MTPPTVPPGTGDYGGVNLDLSTLTPADITASFPALTEEQKQQFELSLVAIRDATQAQVDARVRLANVLSVVSGALGTIGRVVRIVSLT